MKKSNVYTRTGDQGTTSLVSGTRVSKQSPRLEAYGTVDELNSHLGLLASFTDQLSPDTGADLLTIQNTLFNLGALLATEPHSQWQPQYITESHIQWLENRIDTIDADLPRHNRFILPGGCTASAQANVARTVARRAERRMLAVDYSTDDGYSAPGQSPASIPQHLRDAIRYINRLSDYLFVLSRQINKFNNADEIFWQKDC